MGTVNCFSENKLCFFLLKKRLIKEDLEFISKVELSDISWDLFVFKTNIAGMLFSHKDIPDKIKAYFKGYYIRTVYNHNKYKSEIELLLSRLNDVGVTPVLYKGSALALNYYEDEGVRYYRDVDIMVEKKVFRKAKRVILQTANYKKKSVTKLLFKGRFFSLKVPSILFGRHLQFKKGEICIELHTAKKPLFSGVLNEIVCLESKHLFDNLSLKKLNNREYSLFAEEKHLFVIIIHLLKEIVIDNNWNIDSLTLSTSVSDILAILNNTTSESVLEKLWLTVVKNKQLYIKFNIVDTNKFLFLLFSYIKGLGFDDLIDDIFINLQKALAFDDQSRLDSLCRSIQAGATINGRDVFSKRKVSLELQEVVFSQIKKLPKIVVWNDK